MDNKKLFKSALTAFIFFAALNVAISDVAPAAGGAAAPAAAPAACSAQYVASAGTNLLFGGVHDACVKGCQPRADRW